jgi:hypothetical protein
MAPAAEVEIARDNTVLSRAMSRPTGVFTMYTTCLHQRPGASPPLFLFCIHLLFGVKTGSIFAVLLGQ